MNKCNNNNWLPEHEDLLQNWGEKIRYYAWMHYRSAAIYSRLHNMLTFPLIVVSAFTASANFTMIGNDKKDTFTMFVIPLSIGCGGLITAILSSLTKLIQTAEMSTMHTESHRNFNKLMRTVTMELGLPPNQRKPPYEACTIVRTEFDRLILEAPDIPESVIEEFNTKFPSAINKPEEACDFEEIHIYGRDSMLKERADEFIKIRMFYKWRYSVNEKEKLKRDSLNNQLMIQNSAFPMTQLSNLSHMNTNNTSIRFSIDELMTTTLSSKLSSNSANEEDSCIRLSMDEYS